MPKKPTKSTNQFEIKNLCYSSGETSILDSLSVNLGNERIGLVGKNGSGKTTFLRLCIGEIQPTQGKITSSVTVGYVPQHFEAYKGLTIEQVLNIHEHPNYRKHLAQLGVASLELDRLFSTLSGGQQTKVAIAGALVQNPDFLILDEPTNNIDVDARNEVYKLVSNWDKGMLVVSHDQELLSRVDRIIELNEFGFEEYGGNFDFYHEQKSLESMARERIVEKRKLQLKQAEKLRSKTIERQAKQKARAEKKVPDMGIPKIVLNQWINSSEKSGSKVKKMHERKIENKQVELAEAQSKIESNRKIEIDLKETYVPQGKKVAALKDVTFSYPTSENLFSKFDLDIYGPERVAIVGPNGVGKTSLAKLINQDIVPAYGEVKLFVRHTYISQADEVSSAKSLIKLFYERHAHVNRTEMHYWLSKFLFDKVDFTKRYVDLSGGEKLKFRLALELFGDKPPQLLVLDEPTNNMDFLSLEEITSALSQFQGALVLISHNKKFLEEVGIQRYITLPHA